MTLWLDFEPLLLASQSETRKKMLAAAGIPFFSMPAAIDEESLKAAQHNKDAREIAQILAQEKAMVISARYPGRYVLGSDQTLTCNDATFSKPANKGEAAAQLVALSGKAHLLWSAAVLAKDSQPLFTCVASARITLRVLNKSAIEAYLEQVGSKILGSVGAYQLEGEGVHLFESVEGDYWTILGLPMLQICSELRILGLLRN